MAIEKLVFDPENGFEDASTYPDPANEEETRSQLMSIHYQTQEYINTNVQPYMDFIESITGEDIGDIVDAVRGIVKTFTLEAGNWVGNVYSISDVNITPTSTQTLIVSGLTDEQYSALTAATLMDNGQRQGVLEFIARGVVPSIDIPITIQFHGELPD